MSSPTSANTLLFAESLSLRAILRDLTDQPLAAETSSGSLDTSTFARTSAMPPNQADHDLRQALIWRCSGISTLLRRWRNLTWAGNLPRSIAGSREGLPTSVLMAPERNDLMISGPVARVARWMGTIISWARRKWRGVRAIASTDAVISSTRERRNSKRAMGGGLFADCRAIPLRNALIEKSAYVSSRISRTIASKSSRVSLRRSGSVMISNRCKPAPGTRSAASTVPA